MEELLKRELGTKTLKSYGSAGGGCISSGVGYQTDSGPVFVKSNHKEGVSFGVSLLHSPDNQPQKPKQLRLFLGSHGPPSIHGMKRGGQMTHEIEGSFVPRTNYREDNRPTGTTIQGQNTLVQRKVSAPPPKFTLGSVFSETQVAKLDFFQPINGCFLNHFQADVCCLVFRCLGSHNV